MAIIDFHVDPRSGVSLYVQIIQQVRHALVLGLLKPGDRLPTVKEVVAQVAINPNTVLRAYRDLEHEGLVVSKPGLGTFVSASIPVAIAPGSYRSVRNDFQRSIHKARAQGLEDSAISALFARVLHESSKEGVA